MNKVCNFCGNRNFRNMYAQYIYKHNGKMLIVNDVPCEECEYCGEQYFKSDVLKKIENDFTQVYAGSKAPVEELLIPVESFV